MKIFEALLQHWLNTLIIKLNMTIIILIDRFHSTVVLFDSWKNSYRRNGRRQEESFHYRHDVGPYAQSTM